MLRALGWLGVVALAAGAYWFDSDVGRIAAAFAVPGLIGITAPRVLWPALALVLLIECLLLASIGVAGLFAALPALIAAFVAWLFGRTLWHQRTPLIGRAIAAIDGPDQLDDPAIARYARRLTWLWAIWQTALAVCGALIALHAHGAFAALPAWLPGPRLFGALILPGAIIALFLLEFAVRPYLQPHAPRQRLFGFVRDLVRIWPRLLGD